MIGIYLSDGKRLNVRDKPNGEVVKQLESGSMFDVHEVKRGWCKTADGYVSAEFVTIEEGEVATVSDSPIGEAPIETPIETEGSELESMTIDQLIELARNSGVQANRSMRKAAIIDAILAG